MTPPLSETPVGAPDAARERFEGWVRDHHAALFQSAWRIVRNRADADDVVSQLFVELLERPDAIASHPDPARALRWLAVKRALTFRRGATNRRRREEAHAMEHPQAERVRTGDDPRAQSERRERLQALREQVATLSEELRIATVLRFQEGLTFAAMAELEEVSEPTMFERVERALEKLRGALTRAGHGAVAAELEGLLAIEEVVPLSPKLGASLLALSKGSAGIGAGAGLGAGWIAAAAAVVVLAGGAIALRVTRAPRGGGGEPLAASGATASERASGAAIPALAGARRESEASTVPPAPPPAVAASHRAHAGDFLWSDVPLPPDERERTREVETAHLRGTVVDDDDRTFAHVHVTAFSIDGAGKAYQWRSEGDTQSDGSFDLEVAVVVERQRYWLEFAHDDALTRRIDTRVEAGKTKELGRLCARRNQADHAGDFELTLAVVGPHGEPVPRAEVRLHRKLVARADPAATDAPAPVMHVVQMQWEAGGMTDANGALVLRGRRVGEKVVEVRARGTGYRDRRADLRVDAIGASEQRLALEAGLTIGGRLVLVDGGEASFEGSTIVVLPAGTDPGDVVEPIFTQPSADGRFTVRGLDPGRFRLKFVGLFAAAMIDDVEAGSGELVVELKRNDDPRDVGRHLAEIHGRVVDAETGAAVAFDRDDVDLLEVPAGWKPDDPRIESQLIPAADQRQRAQTLQEEGAAPKPTNELHVTGLDAGSYLLLVSARGYARGVSRVVPLKEREIVADLVVPLRRSE